MILNKENGIQISPKVQIGYFAQNGYKFEKDKNVLEFLKESSDYPVSEIRSMISMLGTGTKCNHKKNANIKWWRDCKNFAL